MKEKLRRLWKKLRKEVINKQMLMWLVIAEIIFWAPCIAGVVLGILINPWWFTICTAYMAFWALPLTPAIPIQLGLAYGLKKLADYFRGKRQRDNKKARREQMKALQRYCGARRFKWQKEI